jgi:hypothetical protein
MAVRWRCCWTYWRDAPCGRALCVRVGACACAKLTNHKLKHTRVLLDVRRCDWMQRWWCSHCCRMFRGRPVLALPSVLPQSDGSQHVSFVCLDTFLTLPLPPPRPPPPPLPSRTPPAPIHVAAKSASGKAKGKSGAGASGREAAPVAVPSEVFSRAAALLGRVSADPVAVVSMREVSAPANLPSPPSRSPVCCRVLSCAPTVWQKMLLLVCVCNCCYCCVCWVLVSVRRLHSRAS